MTHLLDAIVLALPEEAFNLKVCGVPAVSYFLVTRLDVPYYLNVWKVSTACYVAFEEEKTMSPFALKTKYVSLKKRTKRSKAMLKDRTT